MNFRLWLEEEEENDGEYWVLSQDLPVIKDKLEKLNRRATKLGMPPVTMDILGKKVFKEPGPKGGIQTVERTQVRLVGAAPKLKGWTFSARIVHGEHGNMVMGVPGEEVPAKYRTSPPACDHCKSSRNRKDTFVVRSDSGEYKQVGTNCLRDFLGTDDPAAYVLYFSELKKLTDSMESDGMSGGRSSSQKETAEFVAITIAVIRIKGFVSKRIADERGFQTTAASVSDYFFGTSKESVAFQKEVDAAVRPDDREKAEKMIAWARSIKDAGEESVDETYLWNLSVAAEGLTVDQRSAGLMASLPSAYERAMGTLRPREERPDRPVPTLKAGDKFEGELTVEKVRSWSTDYGVTTLHIMKDASGQTYKWKASKESLEEGSKVKIKGSVKAVGPDKYEGGAITVELTRCKVLGVVVRDEDRSLMARKAELEGEWRKHMGNLEPFYDRRPLSDEEVERYCREYAIPAVLQSSPEWEVVLKRVSGAAGGAGRVPYEKVKDDFYSELGRSDFGAAATMLKWLAKDDKKLSDELGDIILNFNRSREVPKMASPFIDRMKEVAGDLWKIHAAEGRYGDRGVRG